LCSKCRGGLGKLNVSLKSVLSSIHLEIGRYLKNARVPVEIKKLSLDGDFIKKINLKKIHIDTLSFDGYLLLTFIYVYLFILFLLVVCPCN
jgi:hypothetical protein